MDLIELFSTYYSSLGIAIAALVLITYLLYKYPQWRAKAAENRSIAAAGGSYPGIQQQLDRTKKTSQTEEAQEQAIQKQAIQQTNKKDKTSKKIINTTEQGAQAEEEVEQATTELEETTAALTANLQSSTDQINQIVTEKLAMQEVEKKETTSIAALDQKLRFLNNHTKIDQTTVQYLKKYFANVNAQFKTDIGTEKENLKHHRTFIDKLRQRIQDLNIIETRLKTELKNIKTKEKREQKNFQDDLSALKSHISKKSWQLRIEKWKGRNGNPEIITQLEREIALLQKNAAELEKIITQLNKTYSMIDLELTQLQQILQDLINYTKKETNYAKKLDRREKDINNRLKTMKEHQDKLQKTIKELDSPDKIYPVTLAFSTQIKEYFLFYIFFLKEDITFEQKLREVVQQNIFIEKKLETFQKLLSSLEDTEESIESGIQSIINIISTIMTDNVRSSLQAQRRIIEEAAAKIDYEKKIQSELTALNQAIEKKSAEELTSIDILIKQEQENIASIEALYKENAEHLANSMASMMDRKVAIDENYMQQAKKYGDQLEKRNDIAAAAYKQALSA